MPEDAIYVEYLTIGNWIRIIAPALRNLFSKKSSPKPCCYIFDSTPLAWRVARWWSFWRGFHLERLDFQTVDVHDEKGQIVYWRVAYQDTIEIQNLILKNNDFKTFTAKLDPASNAKFYLAKIPVYSYDFYSPQKYKELWHVAMMTQIARWHQRRSQGASSSFCLYINQRPWMKELQKYVRSYGGDLNSLGRMQLWRWRWPKLMTKLNKINWRLVKTLINHKIFGLKVRQGGLKPKSYFTTDKVRIHTEYYGQLNLDNPACHSDVFFCDGKHLSLENILLTFNLSVDPIDARKYSLLKANDLAAVALTPQASVVDPSLIEVFRPNTQVVGETLAVPIAENNNDELKVLTSALAEYQGIRNYWKDFFKNHNIKLYTSWINCEPSQMAIADAIADVGGVSTIYQRSYEAHPCPQLAVGTDIIFSFHASRFATMSGNEGRFRYHVAVGYPGDYRFDLSRPKAAEIRRQLGEHGAKHIIAFLDENTVEDGRWFIGHRVARENYAFLLEKLLSEPDLGLVLKPKRPANLRQRLGEVNRLLVQAQNTGRCFIFEAGALQGNFPPAAAAMAADIAIHESVSSGTAGLESALAGTKTLMMDFEGWPLSPLYKLGPNVVLRDWDSAWRACLEYFKNPTSRQGLGDWSVMINELDQFHDGLAAQRMSWYLKELLDGLCRKELPLDVMERAAENYAYRWGKDKVQRGPAK
jgi:hypothetical protein